MIYFRVLCETIKNFVELIGVASAVSTEKKDETQATDILSNKCQILQHKLSLLLRTLQIESEASLFLKSLDETHRSCTMDNLDTAASDDTMKIKWHSDSDVSSDAVTKSTESMFSSNQSKKLNKQKVFIPKDHLWSRANSLKKAMKEIVEHTERGN